MGGIWTVARHTFTQCLRTKVAGLFAVLLAAALALLPSIMEGDGTLAGRIRTFLDYGLTVTTVLLALVVVLLSIGVVSDDVRDRHVFVVFSKPLARWKYVLGRWLGVTMLGGLLLAGACGGIYLLAQYLRSRTDLAVRPEDRRAVETEVFTARKQLFPRPVDVDAEIARRVEQKKADGTWQPLVQNYAEQYKINEFQAVEKIVSDLRKDAAAAAQSVAPGRSLVWRFAGVHPAGETVRGRATVRQIARPAGLIAFECPPALTGRLIIFGPVWVDSVAGRVMGTWNDGFRVLFNLEDMNAQRLATLKPDQAVDVAIRPTVQVSYKATPARRDLPEPLRGAWKVENPDSGYVYDIPPYDVPDNQRATLIVPAEAVDKTGGLRLRYFNLSPTSVTILSEDVSVLYAVGGFGANYVKTALLRLMGLAFLAALGVFAGCWLSFPVGCLMCVVLLWITTTLRFLTESIQMGLEFEVKEGAGRAVYQIGHAMLLVVKVLLPDLAATLETDFLVEGVAVPWGYLGESFAMTLLLRATLLLALGCWIFHRRELARVQV